MLKLSLYFKLSGGRVTVLSTYVNVLIHVVLRYSRRGPFIGVFIAYTHNFLCLWQGGELALISAKIKFLRKPPLMGDFLLRCFICLHKLCTNYLCNNCFPVDSLAVRVFSLSIESKVNKSSRNNSFGSWC